MKKWLVIVWICLVFVINFTINNAKEFDKNLDIRNTFKRECDYDVKKWRISRLGGDFYENSLSDVIRCIDYYGHAISFVNKNHQYLKLNCPEGISAINEMLGDQKWNLEDLGNKENILKIAAYIELIYSQKDELVVNEQWQSWQGGTDISSEKQGIMAKGITDKEIHELFHDPNVDIKEDIWHMRFNTMDAFGQLCTWTIEGYCQGDDKYLQIKEINRSDVETFYSFTFPFPRPYRREDIQYLNRKKWKPENEYRNDFLAVVEKDFGQKISTIIIVENLFPCMKKYRFISCDAYPYNHTFSYVDIDGKYYRTNCREGIPYINVMLQEYPFSWEDFSDEDKVVDFIKYIIRVYASKFEILNTPALQKELEKSYVIWKEFERYGLAEFEKIPCVPMVDLKENHQWSISSVVFNKTGGADTWKISGKYDAAQKTNQLITIDIEEKFAPDTFNWPSGYYLNYRDQIK